MQAGDEAAVGVIGQLQAAAVALGSAPGDGQSKAMPGCGLPRSAKEGFA